MKHVVLAALTAGFFVTTATAGKEEPQDAKKAPEVQTLRGEIADAGCYLGREARGAEHKSCALRCLSGGMPMALLTEDGTLYLLTMSHEDAAPYEKAKELAAAIVDVKGPVNERGGMKAIEVTAIQEVDLPDDLGRSDNSPGTIPDTIGTPIDGKKPAAAMMYLCSMHPDVRQDHPGDCPKCGMRLRPEGK